MAEAAPDISGDELLQWPEKDRRRFLHAVIRVGDLDRSIKFCTDCFGMKLLRTRDVPEEKYSKAFLGFGPEESNFVLEFIYNFQSGRRRKSMGGKIIQEPGPYFEGGKTVIAFVEDPDGYNFELFPRPPTPEPLCQVMLRVGDLDRSIKFYEKALGMKLLSKYDLVEHKFTIAMMGYGNENKTTVLELVYNYGVTEYTKGNAYAQLAISTDDVYKSAEVVNLVTQELGGKISQQPGSVPGTNSKITSFLDPDGWKTIRFW